MNFPVRMKHPDHGFMHAYDEDELKRLRGWGWAPEEESKAEAPKEAPKKRGRPKKAQA